MTQDPNKGKKKIPPVAPTYTGADDLFKLKKPIDPTAPPQESEQVIQQDSAVEEKREGAQADQQNEAPDNRYSIQPSARTNGENVPHGNSIPDDNSAGQNVSNQPIQQYGQQANIPLKKSATVPPPQRSVTPAEPQRSQIVERRMVEVTIRIYEDQRREVEDILRTRVNALIDAGVEVDRRKYQVSVIYTELLDFALSLLKQQKQNK